MIFNREKDMIAGFKKLNFQVTSKSQALRSVVFMDVLVPVKRSKDAVKVMYFMFVISWLTHFIWYITLQCAFR